LRSIKSWYRVTLRSALHTPLHIPSALRSNSIRLWLDGHEYFPRIHHLLRQAKHNVVVHMYNWKEDVTGLQLAETLLEIADKGIHVEVLKETTGDIFELHQDFQSTRSSKHSVWNRFWNHPNISVHFTADENHSKVFVIDDTTLLIGSMNISDDYLRSWDCLVELRGRKFVRSYLTQKPEKSASVRIALNTQSVKEIRSCMELFIRNATSSIVVQHSYLGDAHIRSMLAEASHRGVRVTLFIPQQADMCQNMNLEFIAKLMEESNSKNIAVRLLPGFVHGKLVVTDGQNICVGSANLFTHSLDSMGETNVVISHHNKRLHRKLRRYLWYLHLKSMPLITMPRRGIRSRLLAKIGF